MVKIERRDTEKTRKAIQSLEKAKQKSGKYNTPEVFEALQETFHGKCYICEKKNVTSWEIEHLKPQGKDVSLKYDWHNLFLACAHCNHIKGSKYTPILDCTKIDVDDVISFRKLGYFGTEELLDFKRVDGVADSQEIAFTCELLQRVYSGKTTREKFEAKVLRNDVMIELSTFKNYIREYLRLTGENRRDAFELICRELKSNSLFTAFKRWIVRDNPDWCRDFMDCWKKN